jgi:hypothetical protein
MCACFTFFSYLHTKKVCHYSITMWTWLKKIKVSSIKYKCIFSVRNPIDYPIPQPPHPHSTHPQEKRCEFNRIIVERANIDTPSAFSYTWRLTFLSSYRHINKKWRSKTGCMCPTRKDKFHFRLCQSFVH